MLSASLKVLEKDLVRLRTKHVDALLTISNNALERFDPTRRATLSQSIRKYVVDLNAEIARYCTEVQKEALETAEKFLVLSPNLPIAAFERLAAEAFEPSLYEKRFEILEEMIVRKGSRFGIDVGGWKISTGIERSTHSVGAKNTIKRTLSSISNELERIRLQILMDGAKKTHLSGGLSMPFSDLMNDTVDILKADGSRISSQKASVQRNRIFMDADKIIVEPGDLIIRKMSNGAQETFKVIDPCFYEAFGGIPANYQMHVEKLGLPEARSAIKNITYNISGNARINQNSIDNSINIFQLDSRVTNYIGELRSEIGRLHIPDQEKSAAYEIVDEIEEAFQSGNPKKAVVSALLKALPHAANIVSIASGISALLGS